MEYQKITNLLGTTIDEVPRFITKKWAEVHDLSGENYNVSKEIRIKASMLRSDLCDFNDVYIVVKWNITVTKKIFTANDFEAPNNTAATATATNNVNNKAFGKKSLFLKTMLHLSIALQKLMA